MGLFDPLFKFVDVKAVLVGLKRRLQGYIKNPVLFLAATPDKINRLSGL
jgi:hypothetical protein